MKTIIYPGLTLFLALGLTLNSHAQISLTSADILSLIGTQQVVVEDTSGSEITVNLGSAGANQMWDFSDVQLIQPLNATHTYMEAAGTKFADVFPNANVVDMIDFDAPGELYLYFRVDNDALHQEGFAGEAEFEGQVFQQVIADQERVAELPLEYGDNWTSVTRDSTLVQGVVFGTQYDSIIYTVDAWGTAKLPERDYDVLRVRQDYYSESTTSFAGFTTVDTFTSIDYLWVSREAFIVANISSLDGETDPNYTTASAFSYLSSSSGTTPTADQQILTSSLQQNAPNPFYNDTRITFDLEEGQHVSLKIFDMTGKEINTLVEERLKSGSYTYFWDGRDQSGQSVSAGQYAYVLATDEGKQVREMLYLK